MEQVVERDGGIMNNRERALELLENAYEETLWQMFRYLHADMYIKALIFSILNQANEKQLKDFITFFTETDVEAARRYTGLLEDLKEDLNKP